MRIQLYPNVVSKYVLNTPLLVYSQSDTTICIDTRSIRCTIHVSQPDATLHIDTQSIRRRIHVSRPDDLDTRSRYTSNTHTSRVSLSDASDTHPILANTLQIQRRKAVSRSEGIIGAKRVYRCVFACIAACISSRHQNTCFSSVFSMYRASVSERDTCIKLGA